MFETGVRQFRLAMAMVWGRPVTYKVLTRLIDDSLATLAEFGKPGEDVDRLVDGPFADPEVRRDFTIKALRRTARRLATRSPFYAERFSAAGVDPRKLDPESVRKVPVMTKADLVTRQHELLCAGSTPSMSTRTTGSTGQPAEVWMSRYESEVWPAFAALSGLLRGEILPTDHMQICISSRATAAVQQNITICRLVGAHASVVGVVPPEDAMDALVATTPDRPAPTMLATYPSYLALLVTEAERRGLGPADFRLRRIDVGGEVLSPALAAAARAVLGPPLVNDTFAMTEVLPVSGRTCSAGHLHFDLNTGLVEVLSLESGEPAADGEVGSVVITPYAPYRECMPVFRYDTRDLVYPLADADLDCELSAVPATSRILGKASGLVRATPEADPVMPRTVVEALESLPTRPWPARYRLEAEDGALVLTVPEATVGDLGADAVTAHLAERGLHVTLRTVDDAEAAGLRRVRADLVETTFARPRTLTPAGA